jgi:segregation and condensation protein B
MSLKAKLEAVIYAAEEPVTLAQLAALFSADALEWKAEQEAASAEAAAEDATPLLGEEFGMTEREDFSTPENAEETPSVESEAQTGLEVQAELPRETDATLEAEGVAVTPTDEEGEIRRQARLRDREVRGILKKLLDEIIASYASDDRGVEVREIAGGFRMATKPECHDAVRMFVKSLKPALKLSLAALETLAVIAYKQPVTSPEVSEIRGVESAGVLGSLLARKLIATAGRKQVIGRPILYKTTKEFLMRFGLKDVAELPSMEEFEKMAAIELEEPGEETETSVEVPSELDQKEIGWNDSVDSDQEVAENLEVLPMNEADAGIVPVSIGTHPEQELVEESAARESADLPVYPSDVMSDVEAVDAPAERAAAESTEEPVEAHVPTEEPEPASPKDPAQPVNDAE